MVSLLKKTLGTTAGVLLLAAGAIGLAAGCSNTEVTGGADPLATADGFCEAYASAKCSAAVVGNCYHSEETTLDADTAHCVAATSSLDRCNPKNLPYHPEAASAAIDTITAIFEDGQIDGPTNPDNNEQQALNDALASVFYVGLPDGSACTAADDCDIGNGSTCIVHASKGVCAVPVETAPGESCNSPSAQCDSGFYCDDGYHCVSTQGIRQVCHADDECVTAKCGSNNLCQDLLPNQSSCEFDAECSGGFCLKQSGETRKGFCAGYDNFTPFTQSCDALK
jgi:hypothetical protein